jgi:tetratricopeptide (TPR) repeat protein
MYTSNAGKQMPGAASRLRAASTPTPVTPGRPQRPRASTSVQRASSSERPLDQRVCLAQGQARSAGTASTATAIPLGDASGVVPAADLRTREFHWRVSRARNELTEAIRDLSTEIERANHSNERPGTVHFRNLVAKLMENAHAEEALTVLELQLAHGSEPPTTGDYATLATLLMYTGERRLAAELVSRVARPVAEFPVAEDDSQASDEDAADILGRMQILVGAHRDALETITHDQDALAQAEALATEYGSDLPAWRIISVAAWTLAQQTPDAARRAELLHMSAREFGKQSLPRQAQSLFDMGRVDEALELLGRLLQDNSCEQDRFAWWALPFRPSVRLSTRRDEIYASPVWADFARASDSYNPVHEALDRATVELPFELPDTTLPRRSNILSVAELSRGRLASRVEPTVR